MNINDWLFGEWMIFYIPLKRRRRSKLFLRSNIRRSCSADTTLRICRCRYSRWNRVFLCDAMRSITNNVRIVTYSPLTPVHPMKKHRHSTTESEVRTLCASFQHLHIVSCPRRPRRQIWVLALGRSLRWSCRSPHPVDDFKRLIMKVYSIWLGRMYLINTGFPASVNTKYWRAAYASVTAKTY